MSIPLTKFDPSRTYTRASVQDHLEVPKDRRGGNWDTGYTKFEDEFFVFTNVGTAARTGHDYTNLWNGNRLLWQAKNKSSIHQHQIRQLYGGRKPVHVFTREDDRAPFQYQGLGRAAVVRDTTPVEFEWEFEDKWRTPLDREKVAVALQSLGFELDEPGKKSQKATLGDLVIYLKVESESLICVIAPKFSNRVHQLLSIPGVRRPTPSTVYVHNSSYRSFPKRRTIKGKKPIPFGLDFDFDTEEALSEFVSTLTLDVVPSVMGTSSSDDGKDPRTETEALRAARLGQSRFRNDLLDRWHEQCALTGLNMPELLRASHIKPWCASTPKERLDPDNGMLLALHIDGLFDKGFISFDDDGQLLMSAKLDLSTRSALGLEKSRAIVGLNSGNRRYLALHRQKHGFKR